MENSLLSTIIIYDVFPIASLDTNGQTYDLETLVFKKNGKGHRKQRISQPTPQLLKEKNAIPQEPGDLRQRTKGVQ